MKSFVGFILLTLLMLPALLVVALPHNAALAVATEGTTLNDEPGFGGNTATGGSCDYEGFKLSIQDTESCGDGTSRGVPTAVNCYGFSGLYQFGEAALADAGWYQENANGTVDGDNQFEGSWTGRALEYLNPGAATPTTQRITPCGGGCTGGGGRTVSPVMQAFLNNPDAQDAAFHDWMGKVYERTKSCHGFANTTSVVGRNFKNGGTTETCTVTLSGILASGHLCGAGGTCSALRANDGTRGDANSTKCFDYICTHKGYSTPWDSGSAAGAQCQPGSTGGGGGGNETIGEGALSNAPPAVQRNEAASHYENLNDLIDYFWIAALQLMTNTFSTIMMAQAQTIGQFLDAKHQLESHRLFQQKTTEAHKDYQPSEQMCTIGTFVRDLAATERRADYNIQALAKNGIEQSMASGDSISVEGQTSTYMSRLDLYREKYCEGNDNSGGNKDLCEGGEPKAEEINIDIDYTRLIDMPLSLKLDFSDDEQSDDERNVIALMSNLFNHTPPPITNHVTGKQFADLYPQLRSLMAIRSVARDSMSHIIAQKTSGTEESSNAPFIKALLKEMGLEDDEEIDRILGERPSYYAQMEVLTKLMYQNPNFITNLYDKPANVLRVRSALRAVKSMQDRDIHEALIRQEMLKSLLTEMMLRKAQITPYNEARGASD